MMLDGIGKAFDGLVQFCFLSLLIAWPLAIWKLIEIVVWFFRHISWQW